MRLQLELAALYGGEHVAVVGDLTAWAPLDMPFDGERFVIEVEVPRNRQWHYRFCVNGSWMNDPHAEDFVPWADGGVVSIRHS